MTESKGVRAIRKIQEEVEVGQVPMEGFKLPDAPAVPISEREAIVARAKATPATKPKNIGGIQVFAQNALKEK